MELQRLAQLYNAKDLTKDQKLELASKIDTAYNIPDTYRDLKKKSFVGYNCLHVAAMKQDLDFISELLNQGADPLKQGNQNGKTPLHVAVDMKRNCKGKKISEISGKLQNCKIVNSLLLAHVNSNNPFNPKCNSCVSHLHIASMFNYVEAVKLFLRNGESVNQLTNTDASWPLYTPLHFAVRYSSVKTAEVLLKNGADLFAKDAEGTNPLDILISRLLDVADFLNMGQRAIYLPYEEELKRLEMIVSTVIGMNSKRDVNFLGDTGLTTFHLSCLLRDSSIAASFMNDIVDLNIPVDSDNRFWARWTPLHFAACSSVETLEFFMQRGAYVGMKNKKGETPLDMCLKRFSPGILSLILSTNESLNNVLLWDTFNPFLGLILAMDNAASFHEYLGNLDKFNIAVSPVSPILTGYGLLHLALSMNARTKSWDDYLLKTDSSKNVDSLPKVYNCSEDESHLYFDRIQACLTVGCSVDMKNRDNLTPIHLAFKTHLDRPDILEELLNYCQDDALDPDNLSHLHIACAVGNLKAVKMLLLVGTNLNTATTTSFQWYRQPDPSSNFTDSCLISVNSNTTPLHVAVKFEHLDIIKILLDDGANIHAVDSEGFTPIHLSIAQSNGSNELAKMMISRVPGLYEMVTKNGLSHLHVAAFANDAEAIQKLVREGANINRSIDLNVPEFLSRFAGKTPLRITMEMLRGDNVAQTMKTLIECGADVYANDNLQCLMGEVDFDFSHYIVERLQCNQDAKKPIDSSGLTLLHVACSKFDIDWTKELLSKGADVNARIRNDEDYKGAWKGYTALHVLIARKNVSKNESVRWIAGILGQLLVNRGADLMIDTDDGMPLQLDFCNYMGKVDMQDLPLSLPLTLPQRLMRDFDERVKTFQDELAPWMLGKQRSHQINPVSPDGYSHFHFYCMANNTEVVRQYLDNGIDINHSTNPFSGSFAGSTALHFALAFRAFDVVDLLIERGADVNVENVDGNTPIHFMSLIDSRDCWKPAVLSLIRHGANFNAKNLRGETPTDVLTKRTHFGLEQFRFLLENGSTVYIDGKSSLPGPVALIMRNTSADERMEIIKLFISVFDVRDAVKIDYSPIQDIVKAKSEDKVRTAEDYLNIVLEFMNVGHKIDMLDEKGFTALHNAIILDNAEAVVALMNVGADMNACNIEKQIFESGKKFLIEKRLALHVHKMHRLGLYVNVDSDSIYCQFISRFPIDADIEMPIRTEWEQANNFKITRTLTAGAFLTELWGTACYSKLAPEDRQTIDAFFKNVHHLLMNFPLLCGLMMLQYRKAVVRPKLIEIVKEVLISECKICLPNCLDLLLSYVSNDEMNYVIRNSKKADRFFELFKSE